MFRAAISLRPDSPTLAQAFAAPQDVLRGAREPDARLDGEIFTRCGVRDCKLSLSGNPDSGRVLRSSPASVPATHSPACVRMSLGSPPANTRANSFDPSVLRAGWPARSLTHLNFSAEKSSSVSDCVE